MISTLQLKQLGFKKLNTESKDWTWGNYTVTILFGTTHKYEPILHFLENEQIVKTNLISTNGHFEIVKKISTIKELEDVMNMASFVLSKK